MELLLQQLDELARGRAEDAVAAVYDADRALPLGLGERDDRETARALLVQDGRARHDRDAEPHFDRALYRLDVVELGGALDCDAVRAKYPVGRAPRRYVALEVYEALPLQVRRAQLLPPRERVLRAADEDEAVALQVYDFEPAALLRVRDDAEVYGAAEHVAHDARRAAVFEVYLGLRVLLHELAHDRRKLVQADAVHGRHAHRPAHGARELAHALLELAVRLQDLAARVVERLARVRQVKLAPPAHAL